MKKEKPEPHLYATQKGLNCEHCGALEPFTLPVTIPLFTLMLNGFSHKHNRCKPPFVQNGYVDMGLHDEQ